jgi:hypothetical protein
VRPGAGEEPAGDAVLREPLHRAERVVAVAVGPARHDHRRARDPVVARPHRAMAPVGVVARVREPGQQPRLVLRDAGPPLLAPGRTEHRGHRRQRVHRRHVVAVVDEVEPPEQPTHLVDVVGVPVVRRVDRDDRLELLGSLARHLQGVEAAVGRAVHPDAAVAPGLRSEPREHLGEVPLLLDRVLVGGATTAAARASQVEAGHRVVVLVAEPDVLRAVGRGHVVLAVGQRLEDARLRPRRRIRQVERHGQEDPVAHRDPRVAARAHRRRRRRPLRLGDSAVGRLGHGRRPSPRARRTSSTRSASIVRPATPVTSWAASIEASTASSLASTTASK